jgi:peptidoglycan-N-acetylglucosamine deacetylase
MIANPIPWPDGARCAVAITWDLDADSGLNYYNRDRADTLVASQTLTRYGPLVSIPRLVKVLRDFDHRQTFFVPGWCIERYSEACKLLADNGHELALHGYLHERPNELSAEDERYWLKRALGAYENFTGNRPTGWRAPSFAFSKYSLDYLLDEGFRYDSSLMGDDIPYRLDNGRDTLIELPTEWPNDDWVYYMFSRDFSMAMPIHEPRRAVDVFRAQFESCWKHGGLWISVWHPFLSGRLARLDAIIEFMEHMIARGGVWFATLDEIAAHVEKLEAAGTWSPRREKLPAYESPLPEFLERG